MSRLVQVQVRVWAIVAFVLLLAVAVGAGVTWSDHVQHTYIGKLHQETLARQSGATNSQKESDYALCVKVGGVLDAMRAVVDTAFKGTVSITAAQVATLPAVTRELFYQLEPLLKVSADTTSARKTAVLGQVPTSPTCTKPPVSAPKK